MLTLMNTSKAGTGSTTLVLHKNIKAVYHFKVAGHVSALSALLESL